MTNLFPHKSFVCYTFAIVALWSTIAKFCIYSSEKSGVFIYGAFIVLSVLGQIKEKFIDFRNRKFAIILLSAFLILYAISSIFNSSPMGNADYLMLYFLLIFVMSKDEYKKDSFDIFVKLLSFLLFLGLLEYLSFIFFQKYIDLGIVDRDEEVSQSFFHGGACLFRIGLDVYRFQGLAEEAGLLGTLCGFLIFLVSNKKQYRVANIIFWISGILSFSFAFYALAIIKLSHNLKHVKFLICFLVLSFCIYSAFQEFFDGFIIERLMKDNHGDNRSAETLDIALSRSFEDGSLLFGHGKESHNLLKLEKGVAGAKVWIYQYGIICFIIIFLAYTKYYISKCKKMRSQFWQVALFFVAFWLSFYQRQYIEHPYNVIVFFSSPFLLGIKDEKF